MTDASARRLWLPRRVLGSTWLFSLNSFQLISPIVSGEASAVDPERAGLAVNINNEALTSLPVSTQRRYQDIWALVPGVFVRPDQAADVWLGVTSIFRDYGYRRMRTKARLKFLLADWGPEKFRQVLEAEYLSSPLPDGPAAAPVDDRDHVGVHAQSDGNVYIGTVARAGRTSGTQLQRVADLATRYGSGRVATTAQQGLIVLDVPASDAEAVVAALELDDLRVRPSRFRRGTLACTGLEFCKLAIVETKARSVDLYTELEKRLPDFDEPITINVNGCPNSCARFQTGDIGLKGSIVDGVEGFQVHLGGSMGTDPGFGRKSRGLKVTADGAVDYVERLLRTYLEHRNPGERFATWARRADESLLR